MSLEFYNKLSHLKAKAVAPKLKASELDELSTKGFVAADQAVKDYEYSTEKALLIEQYNQNTEEHLGDILPYLASQEAYKLHFPHIDLQDSILKFMQMCEERLAPEQLLNWMDHRELLDETIVEAAIQEQRRLSAWYSNQHIAANIPLEELIASKIEDIRDHWEAQPLSHHLSSQEYQQEVQQILHDAQMQKDEYEQGYLDAAINERATYNALNQQERLATFLVPKEAETDVQCRDRVWHEKCQLLIETVHARAQDNDYLYIDEKEEKQAFIKGVTITPDGMFDPEVLTATYEKQWLADTMLTIHKQAIWYAKSKIDPAAKKGHMLTEGSLPYGKRFVNDYIEYVCDYLNNTDNQEALYLAYQKNCAYLAAYGDLYGDLMDMVQYYGYDFNAHENTIIQHLNRGIQGYQPLTYPYYQQVGELRFANYFGEDSQAINMPVRNAKQFAAALGNMLVWNNQDLYAYGLKNAFIGFEFHRWYDFYEERKGKPNPLPFTKEHPEFVETERNSWLFNGWVDGFGGCFYNMRNDDHTINANLYLIFKEYLEVWSDFFRSPDWLDDMEGMLYDAAQNQFRKALILEIDVIDSLRKLKSPCFHYNLIDEVDISLLIPDLLSIEHGETGLVDGDFRASGLAY